MCGWGCRKRSNDTHTMSEYSKNGVCNYAVVCLGRWSKWLWNHEKAYTNIVFLITHKKPQMPSTNTHTGTFPKRKNHNFRCDWRLTIEHRTAALSREKRAYFEFPFKKNVSWWWWNIIGCAEIAIREGYIALRCVITIFLVISGTAQKTTVTQKSEIIINETMSLFIFGKCAIQTMTIDTSKKSVIVDLTISLFRVLRMIAKELLWKLVTANVHAIERIFDGKLKWITRKSNRT